MEFKSSSLLFRGINSPTLLFQEPAGSHRYHEPVFVYSSPYCYTQRERSSHSGDGLLVVPAGPSVVLFLQAATEDGAVAGPDGGDLDGVDERVEEAVAVDEGAGV